MNAITYLLNAVLQGDLDAGGFRILNLDVSNLGLGSFGPQAPHSIFAGPADAGPDGVPSFRIITPTELGAQPFDTALQTISDSSTPSAAGLNILSLANPLGSSYLKVSSLGVPTLVAAGADVRTDIGAQQATAGLALLAPLTPTTTGKNILIQTNPSSAGYLHINNDIDFTVSIKTPAQLIADVGLISSPFIDSTAIIKGSSDATKLLRIEVDGFTTGTTRVMTPPNYNFTPASISGSESLIAKIINGMTLAVGTAAGPDEITDTITYTETPSQPMTLALVAAGVSGVSVVLRATGPTDVQLPLAGRLAVLSEIIPISYLSGKEDLGGKLSSDLKVPTQLAVKTYVDAHTGIRPPSGDTIASSISVDLTDTTDYVITVTGTDDIEQFILDEDDERLIIFEDELNVVPGTPLLTPGGQTILVKAGSSLLVRGLAGGISNVSDFSKEGGYKRTAFENIFMESGANIGFNDEGGPYFDIGRDASASGGSFARFTKDDHVKLFRYDLASGAILNTDLLTTTNREFKFPDGDGTFGVLVEEVPESNTAPGQNGQWARNGTHLYVYNSAGIAGQWGRVALDFAW